MSEPQPSGAPVGDTSASASAAAASAGGGAPGSWPVQNAAGGSGHTGGGPSNSSNWRQNNSMKYNSRPWHQDREDSGPFRHKVWNNYNHRHSPYHRNNSTNYGGRGRQDRDYANNYHERGERELEWSPKNPRNPENSYRNSGRYRNQRYRDQHQRYQHRRSQENTDKSPIYNDSIVGNESNSHANINESIELAENRPSGETKTEASKVDQQRNKSPSKKHKSNQNNKSPTKKPKQTNQTNKSPSKKPNQQNQFNKSPSKKPRTPPNQNKPNNVVIKNNQKAKKINAIDPSTVASKEPSLEGPKEHKTEDSEKDSTISSECNQIYGLNKASGLNAYKAHSISRTCPIKELKETHSGTVASEDQQPTVSRWQRVESNLSECSEISSTAEASQALLNSPRIQVRPLTQLLKQEILAVTQENRLNLGPIDNPTPAAPTSSPSRQTFKPILKGRRRTVSNSQQNGASPSKNQLEGSEFFINNRIAGMDKQSLKYIINNSDTIYDEHLKIQARKRLREEIRRQLKAIELEQPKDNPVTELVEDEIVDAIKLPELLLQEIEKCFGKDFIEGKKVQETEQNLNSFKEIKDSGTELSNENSKNDQQTSEVSSKESATNSKDSESIQDSEQSIKKSEDQSNEQALRIETVNNKNQNKIKWESTENNNFVLAASKIIPSDNGKVGDISEENQISKKPLSNRKKRIELRKQKKLEYKMKRSKDLMSRLKAADQVKMMAEQRLAKNRGPLLPTPPCGRIFNNVDMPKDQDIGKVQSPNQKLKLTKVVGSESETTDTTAMIASSETTTPPHTKVHMEQSPSPIRESIPNNSNLSKSKDQDIRKTPSPKEASVSTKNQSTALVTPPYINAPLKAEIKREYNTSPIRLSPFPKDVIELLTTSEEDEGEENCVVDMEIDEPEKECDIKEHFMELTPEREPVTIDDAASDHSSSSHCSNESAKRRFKLKLQSDADNVVDSFEKLILPHLRETLSVRYHVQHSANLQSRLHFISCVVTSSEHNPKKFSKIDVAKIQRNLKAPDNRQGIEFLLKEIVSVVNLQKQRRREQEEQMATNGFSPKKAEQGVQETPKPSPLPSSSVISIDQRTPDLSAHQNPLALTSAVSLSPLAALQCPPASPAPQTPQPYSVGLPFMSVDANPYHYAQLRSAYPADPFGQQGDLLSQNVAEIDRLLMENLKRRSILDEIIMNYQREKTHLETINLELQNRKIMLMYASNQKVATAPPPPAVPDRNSASPPQEPVQEESIRQTRSKTKFRLVKLIPKRIVRVTKRIVKRTPTSERVISQIQSEIADQKESEEEHANKEENQSDIKEELQEESVCDNVADSMPTVKPKPSQLSKPKASVSQQLFAIIPPLPPPPPPPESICDLSDELQPSAEYPDPNSQCNVGFIPQGLLDVGSPITQIRIFDKSVIAAAEDGDIYMFHLISHKLERKITKHSEAITNMFLCQTDSILYTTSLDGFLKKTSLKNLERVMQTVYFKEPLQSIDIAWGVAFVGSRWGNVFTYNVLTNKQADTTLVSTNQSIIAIKATKEGVRKILILGCKGSSVYLTDAANGLLLRRLFVPGGLNVYSLLLDDDHIYCGTQKNQIYQFEFGTGHLVTRLNCGNGVVSIVSYKERYLLAGCYDGFIYVLDKVTGKQVGRFEGAGRLVLALAVAGDKVVTSSKDNTLGILEVPAAMVNGQ